jgi:hypothetical protein
MPGDRKPPWIELAGALLWSIGHEWRTRRDIARQKASAGRKRDAMFAKAAAATRAEREEHDRIVAPFLERRAFMDRVRQVEDLFRRRPDLGEAWEEQLIDRFEADGGGGPFQLARGKRTGFRGPLSDSITDLGSGVELVITGGDVADNQYDGAIAGKSFFFSAYRNSIRLWKPLDDERMRALARFFNADVGYWQFSFLDKPVTIIRTKPEFHGKDNYDHMLRAKVAFGERYLD